MPTSAAGAAAPQVHLACDQGRGRPGAEGRISPVLRAGIKDHVQPQTGMQQQTNCRPTLASGEGASPLPCSPTTTAHPHTAHSPELEKRILTNMYSPQAFSLGTIRTLARKAPGLLFCRGVRVMCSGGAAHRRAITRHTSIGNATLKCMGHSLGLLPAMRIARGAGSRPTRSRPPPLYWAPWLAVRAGSPWARTASRR